MSFYMRRKVTELEEKRYMRGWTRADKYIINDVYVNDINVKEKKKMLSTQKFSGAYIFVWPNKLSE